MTVIELLEALADKEPQDEVFITSPDAYLMWPVNVRNAMGLEDLPPSKRVVLIETGGVS